MEAYRVDLATFCKNGGKALRMTDYDGGGRPPPDPGPSQTGRQGPPQPGWQRPAQPSWEGTPQPGRQPRPPLPPKKNFFTRWWFIAILALVVIVVIAAIAAAANKTVGSTVAAEATTEAAEIPENDATSAAAPTTPAPETPAETGTTTPPEDALSDGGWTLESVQLSESLGNFGGTMRVINTDGATRTGFFTLTLLLNGDVVGTALGIANDVEAGSTSTVLLLSGDPFVAGDLTYEFQTEF